MKFVFAGWLGGRPRIACESRAGGSPAHGKAFRVCCRSRAPDWRGEKLAKTLSDRQQCQRGAAVVVGWLRDSTNRAKAPAPTDRPRHRRACRTCARSPVAAALRALLWEEVQEGGVASGAAHHLAVGVLLLLWCWRADMY